jgi:hypothetical protein
VKRYVLLAAAVPAIALAAPGPAPQWRHQADIVKPEPVALGLAGEAVPDITRYLLVRGPQAFELSPDGKTVAYLSDVTASRRFGRFPRAAVGRSSSAMVSASTGSGRPRAPASFFTARIPEATSGSR